MNKQRWHMSSLLNIYALSIKAFRFILTEDWANGMMLAASDEPEMFKIIDCDQTWRPARQQCGQGAGRLPVSPPATVHFDCVHP